MRRKKEQQGLALWQTRLGEEILAYEPFVEPRARRQAFASLPNLRARGLAFVLPSGLCVTDGETPTLIRWPTMSSVRSASESSLTITQTIESDSTPLDLHFNPTQLISIFWREYWKFNSPECGRMGTQFNASGTPAPNSRFHVGTYGLIQERVGSSLLLEAALTPWNRVFDWEVRRGDEGGDLLVRLAVLNRLPIAEHELAMDWAIENCRLLVFGLEQSGQGWVEAMIRKIEELGSHEPKGRAMNPLRGDRAE